MISPVKPRSRNIGRGVRSDSRNSKASRTSSRLTSRFNKFMKNRATNRAHDMTSLGAPERASESSQISHPLVSSMKIMRIIRIYSSSTRQTLSSPHKCDKFLNTSSNKIVTLKLKSNFQKGKKTAISPTHKPKPHYGKKWYIDPKNWSTQCKPQEGFKFLEMKTHNTLTELMTRIKTKTTNQATKREDIKKAKDIEKEMNNILG